MNTSRLNIVGEGRTGKTTWIRVVSNKTFEDTNRENIDTEAESTDGRATLYANGQTHMFERKRCNQKTTGGV